MSVLPVGTFGKDFLISDSIMSAIDFDFEMSVIETKHFILTVLLKLNKLADIIMFMLFSQLNCDI